MEPLFVPLVNCSQSMRCANQRAVQRLGTEREQHRRQRALLNYQTRNRKVNGKWLKQLIKAWRNIAQLLLASKRLRRCERELERNVKQEVVNEFEYTNLASDAATQYALSREYAGIQGREGGINPSPRTRLENNDTAVY